MPQSLAKVLLHVVFSTKHRTPWLKDRELRKELHRYMMGTLQGLECWPSALDGVEDHVHFLCQLSRKIAIMDLIEEVKTSSSKWIKTKGAIYHDFHWQAGYGVFSVSESMRPTVINYIENQEEHHQRLSYQMNFGLCARGTALKSTSATFGLDEVKAWPCRRGVMHIDRWINLDRLMIRNVVVPDALRDACGPKGPTCASPGHRPG